MVHAVSIIACAVTSLILEIYSYINTFQLSDTVYLLIIWYQAARNYNSNKKVAYRPPRSKCSLCCCLLIGRGVPHPVMDGGGVPHPDLGWVPSPPPQSRPGMGYPLPPPAGWGTPPPPRNVYRHTPAKTVPSLVLRTRAVMM